MTVERIQRWNGALISVGGLVGFGLALRMPVLLVAAVIPVTFVIFSELSRLPAKQPLAFERTVEPSSVAPGEHVHVELTVENVGERTLTDVRVVDGVPENLQVIEGAPRASVALRPGTEATIEYDLIARRGEHAFGDPIVRIRTLSGTRRRTDTVEPVGTTDITCLATIGETPLRNEATPRVGELAIDSPGPGLEFYATRAYRTDDPLNRIDWRRYARNGELTTIQYRENRAARVALVVDAREPARFTPHSGHPDGVELSAYAARRVFDSLLEAGHHVGLVGMGIQSEEVDALLPTIEGGFPFVEAGGGPETVAQVEAVLDSVWTQTETPVAVGDGGSSIADPLAGRLRADTQVIVLSPVPDQRAVTLVRRLRTEGYETTVLSPDLTRTTTTGGSVATLQRRSRLMSLRETGAAIIDWDPSEPLWTDLSQALHRLV